MLVDGFFESFHCVKSVQTRSFFWSVFSRIWTEYGDLLRKSSYSVRMQGNTDQNKLRFEHFSRSVLVLIETGKRWDYDQYL